MKITKEDIDELNAVIKLTVEKSDYEPDVDKTLKDYQKKAIIPGFRPGKVPFGLIRKKYRPSVLVEKINKIIPESLEKYINENNLEILADPITSENQPSIDFNEMEDFDFHFDIGLSPEVEIKLTKRDKFPYHQIIASDEIIDIEITNIINRYRQNINSDTVGENSILQGLFEQVDEAGNVVENGITSDESKLSIAVVKDDDIKNQLLSKTIDDSAIFNIRKAFPNDIEISYLLKISKEEATKIDGNFKFTISEIYEYVASEINQDLFDRVFGEGVISSEAEMKSKIKENLEKHFAIESDYKFYIDAQKKLLSKLVIPLPDKFLKRWLIINDKVNEKFTDDELEKELPKFFEDVKWQIVKGKIIKFNGLKIDDNDVFNYAKKMAKLQFMNYGIIHVPESNIDNFASDLMKKEENKNKYIEGAINEKITDWFKETVKLDIKEVSREEFNKFFEEN